MHDNHGNTIRIGDIVRGWGFNLPFAVTGPVLSLTPSTSCNLRLAYGQLQFQSCGDLPPAIVVQAAVEYGTAAEFEIVARVGGPPLEFGPYAGFMSEKQHRRAAEQVQPVTPDRPAA
jgi:hypothetical protein